MTLNFTIMESHETERHKRNNKSKHVARGTQRKEVREGPTTFIGVDGEGVTLADGTHQYVLLTVGDQALENSDGSPLEFTQILDFLWSQHATGKVSFVGFFLGYDFVQWFRSMPGDRASMLLTKDGRAARTPKTDKRPMPFPVRYERWEFDILGTKRFKFRKWSLEQELSERAKVKENLKYKPKRPPWRYVCDTGPFFQKSFLKVIDPKEWKQPVVSPEEYEQIKVGKERRSTAILDDDMRRYNARENEILARVLGQLEDGFHELGINLKPNQWFGPGQAAQTWLHKIGAPTREQIIESIPKWFLDASQWSYYGGRFEIFAHGYIPGPTYEYDINSAYPHAISQLPCLLHGTYTQGDGRLFPYDIAATDICLVRATVKAKRSVARYIGAMPHREASGSIHYPETTTGIFHWDEIQAAISAGIIDPKKVTVHQWWRYQPCACPPPIAEVTELYDMRKRVGKKTPLGIACKLVPNSLYGKFAQSIGEPKFANPVYASLITSRCRIKILNAIGSHPNGIRDVVMIATDGVYFRSPHPTLPISGELGDYDGWNLANDTEDSRGTIKQNITLFKPGVYWDESTRAKIASGETASFKARGVSARDFSAELEGIDQQFRDIVSAGNDRWKWPKVTYPIEFAMVTATQAAIWGRWQDAGTLIPNPTATQNSNPRDKRQNWEIKDGIIVSKCHNYTVGPNKPYDKRFGMEDEDRENPFSDFNLEYLGVDPDGLVGSSIKESLGL